MKKHRYASTLDHHSSRLMQSVPKYFVYKHLYLAWVFFGFLGMFSEFAIAASTKEWFDSSGIRRIDYIPDGFAAIPPSEIIYTGTSSSKAFVASAPYILNIMGVPTVYPLPLNKSRTFDFGGTQPFVNIKTGVSDPNVLQGWSSGSNKAENLDSSRISDSGLQGSIEKRDNLTMIRYQAGDGVVGGTCRTQLVSYPIPPRTHVRWEMVVAFGSTEPDNNWTLTPPGISPVLFWEVKGTSSSSPALSATVDTDPKAPDQFLMLTIFRRDVKSSAPTRVAQVPMIPRNTLIPISIEAFLDERELNAGGKGRFQIWVNGAMVADYQGPTLAPGNGFHSWVIGQYLYRELVPSSNTRATFWSTARMLVLP
ncbi:MAG: hypothetical protein ABIK25_02280 [Pseudomonadota bacterium]